MSRTRRAQHLAWFFLSVLLPLVLGTLFYAACRERSTPLVAWLGRLGLRSASGQSTFQRALPAVVMGALPDFLWAWAFGATMGWVWRNGPLRDARFWLGGGLVVALGCEAGQAFGVISGTFDLVDLTVIGVGYCGAAALAWRTLRMPKERA